MKKTFVIYLDGVAVARFGSALREMAEEELARVQAACTGTSSSAYLREE